MLVRLGLLAHAVVLLSLVLVPLLVLARAVATVFVRLLLLMLLTERGYSCFPCRRPSRSWLRLRILRPWYPHLLRSLL